MKKKQSSGKLDKLPPPAPILPKKENDGLNDDQRKAYNTWVKLQKEGDPTSVEDWLKAKKNFKAQKEKVLQEKKKSKTAGDNDHTYGYVHTPQGPKLVLVDKQGKPKPDEHKQGSGE